MQRNKKSIIRFSALVFIAILWLCSCSSMDPLEEPNDTYQLTLTIGDSHDIETVWDDDCDGDATTDDPEPGLVGETSTLTITSSSDAPYLQIQRYSVEYIPQLSPLWTGGTALPTDLDEPEPLELTINVDSGSTVSQTLYNIMTIDTKLFYAFAGDGYGQFEQGLYVIRVRLYGVQAEKSITLTVDTVVRLMNVDNC